MLTVSKDVRLAIQSKDFNGIGSYRNIYMLLKEAQKRDQLA